MAAISSRIMGGETNTTGVNGWIEALAIGRRPKRTMVRLGILIAFGLCLVGLFSTILLPIHINGPSMQPTYRNGEINFINRMAYAWREPERGDVVGIRFSGNHDMYVKRIIGKPGETVAFSHGKVYINGQKLEEPYLKLASRYWESVPKTLGPEEYYVVGDNRSMPFDDHDKGATERRRIIGRILLPGTS